MNLSPLVLLPFDPRTTPIKFYPTLALQKRPNIALKSTISSLTSTAGSYIGIFRTPATPPIHSVPLRLGQSMIDIMPSQELYLGTALTRRRLNIVLNVLEGKGRKKEACYLLLSATTQCRITTLCLPFRLTSSRNETQHKNTARRSNHA